MTPAIETILSTRLLGIIRMKKYEHPVEVAQALADGGIKALEFTLSGDGALQAIAAARVALDWNIHIGAGTVLTPTAVSRAAEAGAEFIVTPVVNPHVIAACRRLGLPIACGAFTPTEIMTAVEAGADLIKLFPARLGGPQYVRDLLAPFPDLRLMPTGGVSAVNAASYLKAGAAAVAIGGSLVPAQAVAAGAFDEIVERARLYVAAVNGMSNP
jgi:2-dehydro-3-deoxyphosphogluconate aldolase/(4S)-4-hydroxy-2-oxoglutarate aldolase